MSNKFMQAETEGRELFSKWCQHQNLIPIFNQERFGAYDAIIGEDIYEIKYKKNNYYKNWESLLSKKGLLLEETKYNKLREIGAKRVFYMIIYEDNILLHQIDFDYDYPIEHYNCPRTTMGDKTIIKKKCKMIPLNKIQIFKTIK